MVIPQTTVAGHPTERIGVTALLDSGCARVVIADRFMKTAGMVEDGKAVLSMGSAETTSTKEQKVFKGVTI